MEDMRVIWWPNVFFTIKIVKDMIEENDCLIIIWK